MIVQIWYTLNTKLSYHNQSNQVWPITKTKQDNDMTDCIGLVYVENNTELSGPIGPGVVSAKIRQDNDVTNLPCVVYIENKIELL